MEFDLGIYESIIAKLSAGGALTPEEKAAYDALFNIGNQGLDVTGSPDFKALVESFYNDLSGGLTSEFERLYGQGVSRGPDGKVSFTRPGALMEPYQRRGLSILDGPAQGAASEGYGEYLTSLDDARLRALAQAYQSMVPVRQQNIDSFRSAGQLAQGAAQRPVQAIPAAMRPSGGGGSGGGGGGEPPPPRPPIQMPLPKEPNLLERILPGLIGMGGSAGLAGLKEILKPDPMRSPATPMEKFGAGVPAPPTRPYPADFDPNSQRDDTRADRGSYATPSNPFATTNPLANEEYSREQMDMMMGGGATTPGQMNALTPSFGESSFSTEPAMAAPGLPDIPAWDPNQMFNQWTPQNPSMDYWPSYNTYTQPAAQDNSSWQNYQPQQQWQPEPQIEWPTDNWYDTGQEDAQWWDDGGSWYDDYNWSDDNYYW